MLFGLFIDLIQRIAEEYVSYYLTICGMGTDKFLGQLPYWSYGQSLTSTLPMGVQPQSPNANHPNRSHSLHRNFLLIIHTRHMFRINQLYISSKFTHIHRQFLG